MDKTNQNLGASLQIKSNLITRCIQHACKYPDRLALITPTASINYENLLLEILRWKHFFQSKFKTQDRIIIALSRQSDLIHILLALQWLEITYIPIDLNFPAERVLQIMQHSQAHAILIDNTYEWTDKISNTTCECINISSILNSQDPLTIAQDFIPPPHNPKNLAYIIYTSGSTGTPKGVSISYGAMHHFLQCMSAYFLNQQDELVLATTTIAFDIAVLELYLPLWQGQTLLLASQEQHKNPFALLKLLNLYPITLMQATPSLWKMLNHINWEGSKMLHALCGGEPLSQMLADELLGKVCSLWNMYGPTEATVWCSLKKIEANNPITIGKPISNVKFYVFNNQFQHLDNYEKGELFISGPILAEGYFNQPELTHERFFTNPNFPNERLYRVGDIACQTSTQEFIIFGRTDHQVKLHGYRIELEEVENHLQHAPGVHNTAVIVKNEQLIAFVCMKNACVFDEKIIRAHMLKRLPDYMQPKRYITLDTLPLNHNGKLNRQYLAKICEEPMHAHPQDQTFTTLSETQAQLTKIWSQTLLHHQINLHDNFYQLGGHSLLAARLIHDINLVFHCQLSMTAIDQYPTIASMAEYLDHANMRQHAIKHEGFDPLLEAGWSPLNDFQLTFWISQRFDPAGRALTVAGRKRLQGVLTPQRLENAINMVMHHHEALNCHLNWLYPAQRPNKHDKYAEFLYINLSKLNPKEVEQKLETEFEDLYYHSTWTEKKTNLSLRYYLLPNNQCELHLGAAHEFTDETSLYILWRDLSSAYLHGNIHSKPLSLHRLDGWNQHRYLENTGQESAKFWQKYLAHTGLFECPVHWIVLPKPTEKQIYSSYIQLKEHHLNTLKNFMKNYQVNLNEILSAITVKALAKLAPASIPASKEILISSTHSTRNSIQHEQSIGCFLKTITLKIDLQYQEDVINLIQKTHQSFLETTQHQAAPTLVKIGALGLTKKNHKRIINSILKTCFNMLKPLARCFYLAPSVLDAMLKLMNTDRSCTFFLGINILPSFFDSDKISMTTLCEKNIIPYPLHKYNITFIPQVLDICFDRDQHSLQPRMIVSANIQDDLREVLGKLIIEIIEKELQVSLSKEKLQHQS